MKQTSFSEERIEEILRKIPQRDEVFPSQEAIDKTVFKVTEMIEAEEKITRIGFVEFLTVQMRIMKKRWWILQGALLFFAGEWIAVSGDTDYSYRGLSILASLFVILVIPELWKNIEYRSLEIEECSLFNLRRVYAAKLIAFGAIDTILLTFFCIIASRIQDILFADMLKQFVFPVMISATICLLSFSSKRRCSEVTTMIVCGIANVIWMVTAMNETVYSKITPVIWGGLFGVCICLMVYSVRKVLQKRMEYWEVQINGLSVG